MCVCVCVWKYREKVKCSLLFSVENRYVYRSDPRKTIWIHSDTKSLSWRYVFRYTFQQREQSRGELHNVQVQNKHCASLLQINEEDRRELRLARSTRKPDNDGRALLTLNWDGAEADARARNKWCFAILYMKAECSVYAFELSYSKIYKLLAYTYIYSIISYYACLW